MLTADARTTDRPKGSVALVAMLSGAFVGLLVLVVVTGGSDGPPSSSWEPAATRWAHDLPDIVATAIWVPVQAGNRWVVAVAAVAIALAWDRRWGLALGIAGLATYLMSTAIKAAVDRPRITSEQLRAAPRAVAGDASFPSTHAAIAFAACTVLVLYGGRRWAPVLVVAALTAVGRLVLGVHYPLDVLGGALLGAAIAVTTVGVVERVRAAPQPG